MASHSQEGGSKVVSQKFKNVMTCINFHSFLNFSPRVIAWRLQLQTPCPHTAAFKACRKGLRQKAWVAQSLHTSQE